MIEKQFAANEVSRLAGLNWFPREPLPLNELILAVQSAATEVIAVYVVSEWLREQSEAPKPAQIRRMIWEENDKCEKAEKQEDWALTAPGSNHCKRCHGCGFYGGLIGGKYAGEWKWCDCEAAQVKQERDPEFIDVANKERVELIERINRATKTKRGRTEPMHHVTQTIAALSGEEYTVEF